MARIRIGITRAAIALGALAAAAALLGPGTASAQPGSGPGLIETTCTFAQVDAALHAEAPEFAARLDANPERKAKLQEFLALPVEQRKQRLEQRLDERPGARDKIEEKRNSPEARAKFEKLAAVANTCHNY
ncbi:hemophore-related protein [Nocardia sp. NPDC050710]|uniref:hemophore-related protein n=1 Tax=Nocardia sp. NPDC050710 TaxID=3157220 RepID=UPI0033C84D16